MKRIFTATALSLALIGSAQAQHGHGHRHGGYHAPRVVHHHNHVNWIVPALIGGAVVYAATRPEPVLAQPAPVVIYPQVLNEQIILQNTGVVCPAGTAAFFNIRTDRYGRTYYEFDTCK